MKLLAALVIAMQLLAALWLAAVARHGPAGLALAALAYFAVAAGATWWASSRGRVAFAIAAVAGLAAAPALLLTLDAIETGSRERRIAATTVSDVKDEPILARSGREIGIRLSFAAEIARRGHYALFPSLRSADPAMAALTLSAFEWTIDGRPPAGELSSGRHAFVFELYPSILTTAQGRRCLSPAPVPRLGASAPPAPLLVSIAETRYGVTWQGGREERTRHAYSLVELYRGVLAEGFEPCAQR